MFDNLLNSKFYNKCKHAFKCIRTRMAPIRRKKHAMIRFLKKDIADLLTNGLDTHAFGRMDGLMVELNHASCYDMIEGFCDYIGKQLGSIQKQRECPPEFREAVSTLIFAAARYPDLPELCDLRQIFTERYGNIVEHFVSREFIWKLDSTEFTNEERLQVMQSIAEESSISFDAKELQLKLWATPENKHDMLEKGSRKPATELAMPFTDKQRCVEGAPYEEQDDILEKASRKPAELAMPLFDKPKCNEDVPYEEQEDILEKGSRKPAELTMPFTNKQRCVEGAPYEEQDDILEKASRKPAELAMPLFDKLKCNEDVPYEEQEDILEKGSRKPAELAMPLFDKPKCDEDAPWERKNKDMLENYSIKPTGLAMASSNKQKGTEDVPCKRNYGAESAHHTEKVEIQLIQKSVSPVDTNIRNIQKDVKKLNRRAVRLFEKELMEAVELDLNGLPKNGSGAVKFPATEGNKAVQLNVKPNEAVRDCHIEKENDEVLHGSRMPGGPEHNGRYADSGLRAQRPDNQGRPVNPLNDNTRNKAPYTKRNAASLKNPTDKQEINGFLHDKPQHLADLGYPVQKGQGAPERAVTMLPPYVKPKSNMQPVNDDPEKQTPSGYSKPNIRGQTGHLENKDVLRPVSVRRRTAKMPALVDAYVEVPNNEKVASQTPKSHRSHSSRQNGAKYDQNRKCNGADDVGSGTNAQITPSSQSKQTGKRNGTLNHNNDYSRLMQRRQPEADETAIDFGNLLPRNANGQRRQNSGHNGDLDEDERMMDKLLMHYSKKKGSTSTNNEARIDAVQKVSLHPPGRAISLPPESVGPGEDAKVPARSTSLQPDGPRSAHVHPKMPDFDELAARVKALRKA